MVIVPYAHDQPDNAFRARKLGVSATVRRYDYNQRTVAAALAGVLADPAVEAQASRARQFLLREDGAATAADAIERTFAGRRA
jgi:UDP:flavonoid glycosyltransferase YjiC (YdhE family)